MIYLNQLIQQRESVMALADSEGIGIPIRSIIETAEKNGYLEFDSYTSLDYPLFIAEIFSFDGTEMNFKFNGDDIERVKLEIEDLIDKDVSDIKWLCENSTSLVFVVSTMG